MKPIKPLRSLEKNKKLNNHYIEYSLSSSSDLKLESVFEKLNHMSSQTTPVNLSPSDFDSKIVAKSLQNSAKDLPNSNANPFLALRQLKATQQQYEMLRKRMKVLKLKQQKNNCRSQLNHRKIMLHSSIQKLASLQKQRINEWKQQIEERVESQRYSNLQQKLIHHKNVKQVEETIKENKLREYEQRKQQAKYHQNRIKQIQQEAVQVNKQKVDKIKKLQLFSKLSIQSYNKQKLHQFKDKKFKETGSLQMKKMQKQQQIRRLLQLQMQMIERQSRSRILFDSSTEKLKQILNPETNLRSSRISKQSYSPKMSYTQLSQASHKRQEQSLSERLLEVKGEKAQQQSEEKSSTESMTKLSSQKVSQMKNGFSLPEIRPHRKFI